MSHSSLRSSQLNVEERYSHILQPIRDLAKNWDVDIAHFLEEYLEELDKIEITFDDGITTMNFSEAALLIQGSAGVYAKKVEYFHALVYQVLDLVTQKKKSPNQNENEQDDGNVSGQTDENRQFLPLDDIQDSEGTYCKEQDVSTNKSVRPIPEMPTRLIPLKDVEKGDNALFNKKGEILGNHCDFIIDIGYITTDGSILLDLGDKALISMMARHQETLQALELSHRQDDVAAQSSDENNHSVDFQQANNVPELENMMDSSEPNLPSASQTQIQVAPMRPQRKRMELTKTSSCNKTTTLDLWTPIDPYEKSKAVEKPAIKKKPFKIPTSVEDTATRKRKKKAVTKAELPPISEVEEQLFSHRPKFPKNPLKVPCPELEDLFWKEHKMREAAKREEIKKLKKEEIEELEAVEKNDVEEEAAKDLGGEDDDNDEIPQIELNADLFADPPEIRVTNGLSRESSGTFSDLTMSYEDLVQKHVERFLASAAEYAQLTELSRRVSEWEEKIQPKLKEEETHKPFDIHKYGTNILEQLVRGVKKAFRELVKGKQEYEICRYTLATLQLANVYNIELSIVPDRSGNIMDNLYVTLLSTKRHFEDLEDYRAPSANAASSQH